MALNGWVPPNSVDDLSFPTSIPKKTVIRRKIHPVQSKKPAAIENEGEGNWTNFARQSTCAAVVHLGSRSQPIPVKIVWRITLVIGVVLTAVSTYYSTVAFMDLTGTSELILQSNPTLRNEHPKYHICTSSTFNLTILAELGFGDSDMISYLMLSLSLFVVSPLFLNNIDYQEKMEAKFNDIMVKHNIKDVNEVIHKALLRCDEIIVGCIAPGIHLDGVECCAKFFPKGSFPSASGACVSTSGAPVFYQAIPSISFGFIVIVKDHAQSLASLDNSIINPISVNQKGVYFTVSDGVTNPLVALFQSKQYTRIGLWTLIALSKTLVNDEEISSSILAKKACANRKEPDRYRRLIPGFENYTEENCNTAFRQKAINTALGCFILVFPYKGNLPPCRPHQLLKYAREVAKLIREQDKELFTERLECVKDCWKEMYSISASYADLHATSNFTFGNWTITYNDNQIAVLNFYFPTFVTTLLVNHYPTISGWLGILGGNLGLFLGASMVTLIEVIVFCFSCCRSPKTS